MKKILALTAFAFLAFGPSHAQTATQCLVQNVWVPCSMAPQPQFAQAPLSNASSGSVPSLAKAYGSNTTRGNTLVVTFCNGNANNPTAPIIDTLNLTWYRAVQATNGTSFECGVWFAPNTAASLVGGSSDTVTVTPGGTNASIAMTIYEVTGLVYPAAASSPTGPQSLDQTASNTGTATTSPSVSLTPIVPNEYVFVAFGLGTAAQTIIVTSPAALHNDSGQQNPASPVGLFSFVSASYLKTEMAVGSPSATIATSEPWDVVVASFKTLTVPVQGTIEGLGSAGTPAGGVVSVQGVSGGVAVTVNANQGTANSTPWNDNIAQWGGNAVTGGNGTSGSGDPRVNVASDNSAIANWGQGPTAATAPSGATQLGAVAATSYPTAVTNGQLVGAMADKAGRLVVWGQCPRDIVGTANLPNNSNTTATQFIPAGATNFYNDVTSLIITNRSSTATVVTLSDNGSGGNTYTFAIAGNGGMVSNFNPPLTQGTTATAWEVLNSAGVALDYNAVFCKDK